MSQYVRLPVGHQGLATTNGLVEIELPEGFSGSVEFLDALRSSLGRATLQNLGKPGFAAQGRGLEVRASGTREILLDQLSHPVRCYLRCAAEANAVRVTTCPVDGHEEGWPLEGGVAASFELPKGFKGLVQVIDQRGQPVVKLNIAHTAGGGAGVQVRARPGLRADSHVTDRLIELRVTSIDLSAGAAATLYAGEAGDHE